MKKERLLAEAQYFLYGHLLNPLWLSRQERHARRVSARVDTIRQYIAKEYLPAATESAQRETTSTRKQTVEAQERLWTIWLQGEDQAPRLIKRCIRSLREYSDIPVEVLSLEQLKSTIFLPQIIWEKYEKGILSPTHFSDICRVELLYQYGGFWMDATCLMNAPIPDSIRESSFFMMRTCPGITGEYSFYQNCFIRAKKGSPTLALWRALILSYWINENSLMDYFQHQIFAQIAIDYYPPAHQETHQMPRISHEAVHQLWHKHGDEHYSPDIYRKLCNESFFQKTSHKDKKIFPGSIKEHILNDL